MDKLSSEWKIDLSAFLFPKFWNIYASIQ